MSAAQTASSQRAKLRLKPVGPEQDDVIYLADASANSTNSASDSSSGATSQSATGEPLGAPEPVSVREMVLHSILTGLLGGVRPDQLVHAYEARGSSSGGGSRRRSALSVAALRSSSTGGGASSGGLPLVMSALGDVRAQLDMAAGLVHLDVVEQRQPAAAAAAGDRRRALAEVPQLRFALGDDQDQWDESELEEEEDMDAPDEGEGAVPNLRRFLSIATRTTSGNSGGSGHVDGYGSLSAVRGVVRRVLQTSSCGTAATAPNASSTSAASVGLASVGGVSSACASPAVDATGVALGVLAGAVSDLDRLGKQMADQQSNMVALLGTLDDKFSAKDEVRVGRVECGGRNPKRGVAPPPHRVGSPARSLLAPRSCMPAALSTLRLCSVCTYAPRPTHPIQVYRTSIALLASEADVAFNTTAAKAQRLLELVEQTLAQQNANADALVATLNLLQVKACLLPHHPLPPPLRGCCVLCPLLPSKLLGLAALLADLSAHLLRHGNRHAFSSAAVQSTLNEAEAATSRAVVTAAAILEGYGANGPAAWLSTEDDLSTYSACLYSRGASRAVAFRTSWAQAATGNATAYYSAAASTLASATAAAAAKAAGAAAAAAAEAGARRRRAMEAGAAGAGSVADAGGCVWPAWLQLLPASLQRGIITFAQTLGPWVSEALGVQHCAAAGCLAGAEYGVPVTGTAAQGTSVAAAAHATGRNPPSPPAAEALAGPDGSGTSTFDLLLPKWNRRYSPTASHLPDPGEGAPAPAATATERLLLTSLGGSSSDSGDGSGSGDGSSTGADDAYYADFMGYSLPTGDGYDYR